MAHSTVDAKAGHSGLSRGQRILIQKAATHLVLGVGGLAMILPFFWLVSSSLKRPETIYAFPPQWIPKPAYWKNYVEVFRIAPVMRYAQNTLIISLTATVGQVITASLAGYCYARLRFPGRDIMFAAILATMMLPFAVTMIPVYVLFSRLKWVGTLLPLIVPSWFGGGAFNIFLLRQFFRTVPMELDEAAVLDGASKLRIFWSIILPLARPAITVVGILSFMRHWNDFMGPLIYLTNRQLWTLAQGVNGLKEFEAGLDWTHYMLVLSTMMVTPIIIIYFVAQRAFIQGIALTGIKG